MLSLNSVMPNHYKITIEPNFEDFTFVGYTLIDLFSKDSVSNLNLNFADLAFDSCILLGIKRKKEIQ